MVQASGVSSHSAGRRCTHARPRTYISSKAASAVAKMNGWMRTPRTRGERSSQDVLSGLVFGSSASRTRRTVRAGFCPRSRPFTERGRRAKAPVGQYRPPCGALVSSTNSKWPGLPRTPHRREDGIFASKVLPALRRPHFPESARRRDARVVCVVL